MKSIIYPLYKEKQFQQADNKCYYWSSQKGI